MEANKVMDIALSAGEILLGNGAESFRIEDTVLRICSAYGFEAECLALSSGIVITIIVSEWDKITSMKKEKKKRVDLYRIELINSFSRELNASPMDYNEAKAELKKIKAAPNFTFSVRTVAACMTGFIYTLFFQGSFFDALAAIIVCLLVYVLLEKISQLGFFQFLEFFLAGLFIGGLSILFNSIFPSIDEGQVITGAIMILLPGVILTNGIKEVIYGEFSAGVTKFFEALIIITAVSVGIGTALFLRINAFN